MSTSGIPSGASVDLSRAGFWRRAGAIIVDAIVVLVPFQILAAVLFSATAGKVQMHSGLTFKHCDKAAIPQLLNPPPPHDSNFAVICRVKFFGATTGAVLTVGRVTKEGAITKNVNQGYMVNENGDPIDGTSIDWIALLSLLAYLVGMIHKSGKTIGVRIAGIRYIDVLAPDRAGVPVRKAVLRYLTMWIGSIPALALLAYRRITTDGSAGAMFAGSFFQWLIAAALIAVAWCVWLIVQIVRKTDPAYDRLAGTALVIDRRQKG